MRNKTLYLLLLLVGVILAGCESPNKRPANIYIPDGYVGWVRLEYGVPNTPGLKADLLGPMEYQRFPPSGLLQTSSTAKPGAASANYFYYSGDQEKPLGDEFINGGLFSGCMHKPDGGRLEKDFTTFFVGPKEEYEKHKQELERFKKGFCDYVISSLDDLPKVGNLAAAAR